MRAAVDADEMVGEATEGTWGTKIRRVGTGEQSLALSDFRSMQRANEELRARLAAKEQSFDQLVVQIEADQLQHAKVGMGECKHAWYPCGGGGWQLRRLGSWGGAGPEGGV